MISTRDIGKYLRYIFDSNSYKPLTAEPDLTEHALLTAATIRGVYRPAMIMIHGIMPRSGTVYIGELIRQHPDIYAYPHNLFELPFLQQTGILENLQDKFIWAHRHNVGKIGRFELLPIFGAGLVAYLHQESPREKRVLVKVPSVQYLTHFRVVFPYEQLIILVRDGRDIVHSTLRTWPQLNFLLVCRRWKRAAQMVLAYQDMHSWQKQGYWLARFEDAVYSPESFMREICIRFELDSKRYPWDKLTNLPVRGSSQLATEGKVNWTPVEMPEGFHPIGQWQQWTAFRKSLFKWIAGRELISMGYEQDMRW